MAAVPQHLVDALTERLDESLAAALAFAEDSTEIKVAKGKVSSAGVTLEKRIDNTKVGRRGGTIGEVFADSTYPQKVAEYQRLYNNEAKRCGAAGKALDRELGQIETALETMMVGLETVQEELGTMKAEVDAADTPTGKEDAIFMANLRAGVTSAKGSTDAAVMDGLDARTTRQAIRKTVWDLRNAFALSAVRRKMWTAGPLVKWEKNGSIPVWIGAMNALLSPNSHFDKTHLGLHHDDSSHFRDVPLQPLRLEILISSPKLAILKEMHRLARLRVEYSEAEENQDERLREERGKDDTALRLTAVMLRVLYRALEEYAKLSPDARQSVKAFLGKVVSRTLGVEYLRQFEVVKIRSVDAPYAILEGPDDKRGWQWWMQQVYNPLEWHTHHTFHDSRYTAIRDVVEEEKRKSWRAKI